MRRAVECFQIWTNMKAPQMFQRSFRFKKKKTKVKLRERFKWNFNVNFIPKFSRPFLLRFVNLLSMNSSGIWKLLLVSRTFLMVSITQKFLWCFHISLTPYIILNYFNCSLRQQFQFYFRFRYRTFCFASK